MVLTLHFQYVSSVCSVDYNVFVLEPFKVEYLEKYCLCHMINQQYCGSRCSLYIFLGFNVLTKTATHTHIGFELTLS